MESNICMLCSNDLTEEEEIFRPCECSMKYCFYCFRDLFEKMNGTRQGACPQCMLPLKARIQVPQANKPRKLETSNKDKLRFIRVLEKTAIYLQNIPSSLSVSILQSENYCGRYGEISKISIDLKYFPSDLPETYRVFVHFKHIESAHKALVALNDFFIGNKQIKAEYIITSFCGNFIKNKQCYIRNCKFLHEIPLDCEWFTVEELKKNPEINKAKDLENYEVLVNQSEGFPRVNVLRTQGVLWNIQVPKASNKYKPKYIPVANLAFQQGPSIEPDKNLKKNTSITEYSAKLQKNASKTKGGVFQLLSEDD